MAPAPPPPSSDENLYGIVSHPQQAAPLPLAGGSEGVYGVGACLLPVARLGFDDFLPTPAAGPSTVVLILASTHTPTTVPNADAENVYESVYESVDLQVLSVGQWWCHLFPCFFASDFAGTLQLHDSFRNMSHRFSATALYDYEATREDELSFAEGESIEIINRNDDGWFEGIIGPNRRGLFPGMLVI
jgi:hypothetical protein